MIRSAEKRDVAEIVVLCGEHAAYERADYDPTNKAALLSIALFGPNPSLQCLVVEDEETVIGYATFMKQFSTWDAHFYLYLDCLYLKESTRGKGLGSLLMERIIVYAKQEDCREIQWQTPEFNEKAIRFYRKLGGVSKRKERFCLEV